MNKNSFKITVQLNRFDCVLVLPAVFKEKCFGIDIKIPEFEKLQKYAHYFPFAKLLRSLLKIPSLWGIINSNSS